MSADKLQKTQQQIARFERAYARERIKERKADTREKIEFGGLVKKAGMHNYSKAVILGVLIEAAAQLENDDDLLKQYQRKGDAAFKNYEV